MKTTIENDATGAAVITKTDKARELLKKNNPSSGTATQKKNNEMISKLTKLVNELTAKSLEQKTQVETQEKLTRQLQDDFANNLTAQNLQKQELLNKLAQTEDALNKAQEAQKSALESQLKATTDIVNNTLTETEGTLKMAQEAQKSAFETQLQTTHDSLLKILSENEKKHSTAQEEQKKEFAHLKETNEAVSARLDTQETIGASLQKELTLTGIETQKAVRALFQNIVEIEKTQNIFALDLISTQNAAEIEIPSSEELEFPLLTMEVYTLNSIVRNYKGCSYLDNDIKNIEKKNLLTQERLTALVEEGDIDQPDIELSGSDADSHGDL